ncbi:putative membrane protein YczE [Fontibacillus solani]|uniref:Putative membrane protein YczE n=1 Tax=Fontibacillus solani TaxID=1572857 RepID=A0A7W3SX71_9BACL|nr:YitT family protein [Fontibacillus solani]MBA9087916.1 putative membrane protein YczE [Fontibacillus solani]
MGTRVKIRVEPRRLIIMLIGNIFMGLGVAIFKLSGLGNDPFNGMAMALAEYIGLSYATFLIMLNLGLFVVQFFAGRKFIGAGTIVNAFLLGYFITYIYDSALGLFGEPLVLWQQVITVVVGVVVISFGISLYQASNVGVSPYDSLSLIMKNYLPKIPYFWHRMFTDIICALICFLFGGIVGLGTLVSAFCLGPIVQFFDVHVSEKLLAEGRKHI